MSRDDRAGGEGLTAEERAARLYDELLPAVNAEGGDGGGEGSGESPGHTEAAEGLGGAETGAEGAREGNEG